MRYPVIIHPNEKLRQPCEPITTITDELVKLLDDMYETMVAHDGIGIAAPQVGKAIQVAIVELDGDERFEMINPVILEKKGSSIDVEGCLSIPHIYGTVERAEEITVRYYDREGDEMEVEAYGYLARAMQHEIDHLNGILFTDHMIQQIPEEELDKYMEENGDD